MKLTNADGNFVVIINNDNFRVDTLIYEHEYQYIHGVNSIFERTTGYSFYCGEILKHSFKTKETKSKKKVKDNVENLCMEMIEELSIEDPQRFRVPIITSNGTTYLNGDWRVTDDDKTK